MIGHLNSPHAAKSTGDMTQLVGDLAKRVDGNGDGSVTSAEFAQFLTQLIDKSNSSATRPGSSTGAPAPTVLDTVRKILGRFPATPAGLLEAMPSIQAGVPGTTLVGHDELDIPGAGRINVGLSFGNDGGPIWRGSR